MISEDVEIISNGKRILLEKGDKIDFDDNQIEKLKSSYSDAVKVGDTEKAEQLAIFLEKLGYGVK